MRLKPLALRKLSKAYHNVITPGKLKEQRPLDGAEYTEREHILPVDDDISVLLTDQTEGDVKVGLTLADLPRDIFRCVTDFLPRASTLALRHVCREFQYRVWLTYEEVSKKERLEYLLLCSKDSPYAPDGWHVCGDCEKIRPRIAFADRSLTLDDFTEVANCLRHSKIWVCTHRSYSRNDLSKLAATQPMAAPLINESSMMCCGLPHCDMWFSHKLYLDAVDPAQYSLRSSILVTRIRQDGGREREGDIRRAIPLHFNGPRLLTVFSKMDVPICEHGLLNGSQMLPQLGRRSDEVEITDLRAGNPRKAKAKERSYATGTCKACTLVGTKTECRLNIVITNEGRETVIDLRVLLTRSLGTLAKLDETGSHWRNHAMGQEKLSGFIHTWSRWAG